MSILSTAARFLSSRKAVATALTANEIAGHVPQALRDASVFSARTIWAEHVSETQRDIAESLDGRLGPAEIRTRMKLRLARLGYRPDPEQRDGLQDLSSDMRTNLIISMQESRARGYAAWRSHQREAILKVWPADELFRAEARKVPRHWRKRWHEARLDLGEGNTTATYAATDRGPFVALKNDPVWTHPSVNRFGEPWTPFDFNSGMRLRNVTASKARELGVLKGKDSPAPRRDPLRQVQSSSTLGMSPEVVRAWAGSFGDRARVTDGRVAVVPDASVIAEIVDAAEAKDLADASAVFGWVPQDVIAQLPELLRSKLSPETVYTLNAERVRHILKQHGLETRRGQRDVTRADIESLHRSLAAGGRWREATAQEKKGFQGEAAVFVGDDGVRIGFRLHRSRRISFLDVHTVYIQVVK